MVKKLIRLCLAVLSFVCLISGSFESVRAQGNNIASITIEVMSVWRFYFPIYYLF